MKDLQTIIKCFKNIHATMDKNDILELKQQPIPADFR